MYISVESYEEMYLNNKDVAAIEREVEKIRSEISRLKMKMESPAYLYSQGGAPSDVEVVEIYRAYFEKAAEVLSDRLGGVCVLTEEEKAAIIVDSMVDDIKCLTLTVGEYLENKYELDLGTDTAAVTEIHLGEAPTVRYVDSAAVLRAMRSLHLGEWKQNYLPEQYGCTLNEPTKWQVRIDYAGGAAPRFYDGLGVFPYNFSALCKLLGAEVY